MNFPTFLVNSFSFTYWKMEMKFSLLSLMSLNPIKVLEFLRCSLKFRNDWTGLLKKRELMLYEQGQTFLYSNLMQGRFKNVTFKTVTPLRIGFLKKYIYSYTSAQEAISFSVIRSFIHFIQMPQHRTISWAGSILYPISGSVTGSYNSTLSTHPRLTLSWSLYVYGFTNKILNVSHTPYAKVCILNPTFVPRFTVANNVTFVQ